jgi:hypothetical protein
MPVVAISSDGISKFLDIAGEEERILDVSRGIISFRNIRGDFAKRRVKRMIENYAETRIYHMDDISVGVFLNETIWRPLCKGEF